MAPLRPVVLFNGVVDPLQWCASATRGCRRLRRGCEGTTSEPGAKTQLVDVHGDFGALYQFAERFSLLDSP